MVNASPVFADVISLDDPTLNPEQAAAMLSPATAAVVPMHYGGQAAKVSELIAVAGRVGAAVIEDACHALGGLYRESSSLGGRPVGAAGAAGCYSFFSNKNLACGEGGMIATDRRDIADQARLLRSHGMTSLSWDRHQGHATGYTVERPGLNYRMDDLRAAVGRAQLVKLKRNTEARQDLVANYRRLMAEVDGWAVPFSQQVLDGSAAHLMVVLAPDSSSRDRTRERLARAGIQTSFHYPCVADFPPFRDCRSDGLPVTREFVSRALTLPLHPLMGSEDVEAVVETVAAAT
jgi:dTDP-4-amino-4,6-dideoxygalactose transaminase